MPVRLQVKRIKAWLKKKGVEPDLVDVDALVDPKLTYRENLAIVKREVHAKLEEQREALDELLRAAEWAHTSRSEHAQLLDEKLKAKIVIRPRKATSKTLRLLERYVKHPERLDVEGIDTGHITIKHKGKTKKHMKHKKH